MKSFKIWDQYMQSYDFLTTVDGYNRNLQDIITTLKLKPGESVLDAGSGTGNLSIALARAGAKVKSCDFSPSAIAAHLKKDPKANVVQASLEEPLPFGNGEFDVIACASVLFSLSESGHANALREFQRVLKKNGRIVVTVPAREARLRSLVKMYFSTLVSGHGVLTGSIRAVYNVRVLINILRYNRMLMQLPDWEGFHIFSEQELKSTISNAGFRNVIVQRTYGDCFLIATASLSAGRLTSTPTSFPTA